MYTINSRFDVSTLNNHSKSIEKNMPKKKIDAFAKLIKLGLASNTSVSDHVIWQTYNGIWSHISTSDFTKGQLNAILPTVENVIKAYQASIDEARYYGLLEEHEGPVYTKSL